MKRLIVTLISVLLIIPTVSCTDTSSFMYTIFNSKIDIDPHSPSSDSSRHQKELTTAMAERIMRYLDDKDKDGLKSLFSPAVSEEFDLDKQIDKVFSLYDGKSVTYEVDTAEKGGAYVKDGRYMWINYTCEVKNIRLDNDKEFTIFIRRCAVDDEKPDNAGLTRITLRDKDGKRLAPIGKFGDDEEFFG